jgi:glycosyltransferase involved in cell wall biosynthesis
MTKLPDLEKDKSNRGKRIVLVSSLVFDQTLHKTSRIQILENLAKRGHEVYLVGMYSREKPSLEKSGIHTISFPMRFQPVLSPVLYVVALVFYLPFFLLVKKPNFIIIEPQEQFFSLVPCAMLFPAKRFKFVLDIRSTPVSSIRAQGLLGHLKTFNFAVFLHLSKRLFDGITIITSLMKEEVCAQYGLDRNRVGVWVDGVSKELFKREKYDSDRLRLRRKFRVVDKLVLFYHGTFDGNRGLTESIESMQLVKSKYPKVVLFMLGTGPLRRHLIELVKQRQLEDNVIFHDAVAYEDVPRYIAISDVGLVPLPNLPSWRNQCPLNLIEYLAMKKPVLLTDIPANREIVGSEKCGLYISCDPLSIASSVDYVYENREKLEEWGESGRHIVEDKYNWEKAAITFEEYLLALE